MIPIWNDNPPGFNPEFSQLPASLDPWPCSREGKSPAFVVCPGGGYAHKAAHEGAPVARWLSSLGISAYVLDYRVSPYRHPSQLQDAQRAIRYLRAHADALGIDPVRIGILGFSAGGHLAASAGVFHDAGVADAIDPVDRESCRPDVMVLCYPVISFGEYGHRGSANNLLGEDASDGLLHRMSLENSADRSTSPAFIWHTADDSGVSVANSLLMSRALTGFGVPHELHVFPHGRHGLGLAEGVERVSAWTSLCADWLTRIGFLR